MLRRFIHLGLLGLVSTVPQLNVLQFNLQAEDSPTFRGSERTSVYDGNKLLKSWPAEGPKLLWETKGAGRGYASVAIASGKFYTLGDGLSTASDKDEYLTCFDQATGKQLWKAKTGEAWNSGKDDWQSSRSTPTVDGNMIYVVTPHGELVACETSNGKEKWRINLKEKFGGKKADSWGYSESVLIDGPQLVCTPGGEAATMVALDKTNGNVVWKCSSPGDIGAGHASIVISQIGGTKVYVQTTGSGVLGVAAKTGERLWHYPIEKTTAVIPTPIVAGDRVFFSVGYKRGGALLQQVPAGNGKVTIKEVYGLNNQLANKHGGVVKVGEYVYGDSDDQGVPFCADINTGEIKWKKRGSGKSSAVVIAGDGMLYVQFADGTLALAKATNEDYVEVSSMKIPGSGDRPSWAHPVIADGKLYLRQQDRILCYSIAAK